MMHYCEYFVKYLWYSEKVYQQRTRRMSDAANKPFFFSAKFKYHYSCTSKDFCLLLSYRYMMINHVCNRVELYYFSVVSLHNSLHMGWIFVFKHRLDPRSTSRRHQLSEWLWPFYYLDLTVLLRNCCPTRLLLASAVCVQHISSL